VTVMTARSEGQRESYQVRLDLRKGPRGWQIYRATGWQEAPQQFGQRLPAMTLAGERQGQLGCGTAG
jgi:hypothetical protein